MASNQVVQERVRFGDDGRLSGVLHYSANETPSHAVFLCSPHPNFAGNMENNVIVALADVLAGNSVVLRFDYRGVGDSRITLPAGVSVLDYWEEVEQALNYADALADAADAVNELSRVAGDLPVFAVGYSFGSFIASRVALDDPRCKAMVAIAPPLIRIPFDFLSQRSKPCLILAGTSDFVYDPAKAATLIASSGVQIRLQQLDGMDHFFRGHEQEIARIVGEYIIQSNARR